MDAQQPHTHIDVTPAYLWVGNHDNLVKKTKAWLKNRLCPSSGCSRCVTCRQIDAQEHHAVIWLSTDKQYTLDTIEIIHETIAYRLAEGQECFFVLQKADHLSTQSSNSLLKSIEEPPAGYHFILLSESLETIIPTIRSRCRVEMDKKVEFSCGIHMSLWNHFTSSQTNPAQFLKDIEETKLSEHEAAQLCDALFAFWIEKAKKALSADNDTAYERAQKHIAVYQRHLHMLPMPGSSKLFLKNLYLQSAQLRS